MRPSCRGMNTTEAKATGLPSSVTVPLTGVVLLLPPPQPAAAITRAKACRHKACQRIGMAPFLLLRGSQQVNSAVAPVGRHGRPGPRSGLIVTDRLAVVAAAEQLVR